MNASEAEEHGIGAGSVFRRKADGGYECVTDEVVIEEPLEIRIGQDPLAVTMRTPATTRSSRPASSSPRESCACGAICARSPGA